MKLQKFVAQGLMALVVVATLTGCQSRFLANRYYDLRDTFNVGAGVTAENSITGMIPPSFGLHAQVTDFVQLGWITHNGYTAELDQRGTFVGPEAMTRAGFLWWQYLRHNQAYGQASYMNPFKDADALWCIRMESYLLAFQGRPAKRLHYEFWAPYAHEGTLLLHQGWQYWGNTGVKVALCEPFLTHLGFMLELGVDPSEIMDFALGLVFIDFKHDDMLKEEFADFRNRQQGKPTVEAPEPAAPMVTTQAEEPETMPETLPVPPDQGVQRNIQIQPYPEMNIIYFDYDSSDIRADQLPRVEHNLGVLKNTPDAIVQIVGHTDERGTLEYNYNLGLRRANAVRDYLMNNGIAADRIQFQSRGEETPADPADTEAAWALNRRAELMRVVVIETATSN
jgi:outer membrane protein OmpA-like peptidoglycan-associated protein